MRKKKYLYGIISLFMILSVRAQNLVDNVYFASPSAIGLDDSYKLSLGVSHSFVGFDKSPKELNLDVAIPLFPRKTQRSARTPRHFIGMGAKSMFYGAHIYSSVMTSYAYKWLIREHIFINFGMSTGILMENHDLNKLMNTDPLSSSQIVPRSKQAFAWQASVMLVTPYFYASIFKEIENAYSIQVGVHNGLNRRRKKREDYYSDEKKKNIGVHFNAISTYYAETSMLKKIGFKANFLLDIGVFTIGVGYSLPKDFSVQGGIRIKSVKISYAYHFFNTQLTLPKHELGLLMKMNNRTYDNK